MKTTTVIWAILFCAPFLVKGQRDTLPTVDVNTNLIFKEGAGHYDYTFEKRDLVHFEQSDLGVLLEQRSPIVIRRYGPGGITSASFRGGNANHTLLLWNGLPLNSITTGQADFSLVPTGAFNAVRLQFGGESTQWGSGAIGGSIQLENKPTYKRGLQASVTGMAGSFSNRLFQGRLAFSTEKFATSIFIAQQQAKNDFPFYNPTLQGHPKQIQPNMNLQQRTFLLNHFHRIGKNHELGLFYWYQTHNKNIPPTLTQRAYNAFQEDASHRIAAQWKYRKQSWEWAYRMGAFQERLDFTDSSAAIFGNTLSYSLVQDAQIIKNTKKARLQLGVQHQYQQAVYEQLSIRPEQVRASAYGSVQGHLLKSRLEWSAALRLESVSQEETPLLYTIGVHYFTTKYLSFRLNGARVYRVPTLNDLYWVPGGNPNLLPESGYTYEAGFTLANENDDKPQFTVVIDATAFSRHMENWILWLPQNALWTAQNVLEVWSRGVETRIAISHVIQHSKIHTELKTNYILSTQESSLQGNDAALGKQLMYVPMYTGQWLFGATFWKMDIRWITTYTGYRYTASDHSGYLDPFWLNGLQLSTEHRLPKKTKGSFFLRLNNIFNTPYQMIQNRPMPLMNTEVGVTFHFNS